MDNWGCKLVFFFNDTATTEIYTLSLHDALPISLKKLEGNDKQKKEIWNYCKNSAEKVLRGEPIIVRIELANSTNYIVRPNNCDPRINTRYDEAKRCNLPGWLYQKEEDGVTFKLDKNGRRLPLESIFATKTNLGEIGRAHV